MALKFKNIFALLLICVLLALSTSVIFAQDEATEEAPAAATEEGEVLGGIVNEEPTAAAETGDEDEVVDEAADEVTAETEEGAAATGAESETVDAEAEPEVEAATGLGTFFLLIGVLGVVAVGVVFMARDSYKPDTETE